MTSFNQQALRQHSALFEQHLLQFHHWCEQNKLKPVSTWMAEHGAQTQDLFIAGLITYPNAYISAAAFGTTATAAFTEESTSYIAQYTALSCWKTHALAFSYVIDELALATLLQPQLIKDITARHKDYKAEQAALYNAEPTLEQCEQYYKTRFNHEATRAKYS